MTLSRLAAVGSGVRGRGTVAVPWRATAKVKAAPTHALFEQLEYSYGPEARAIRLTGTAEFRFGKTPRFDSVLSARQADLDRALALPEAVRPAAARGAEGVHRAVCVVLSVRHFRCGSASASTR